jgi:DNA invertase Pin-like site-specific DNA recombinase
VLLVWRSDRMFRSLKNMLVTLDDLTALGIAFTSVTEPFDTTCPSGKLLLHIVSAYLLSGIPLCGSILGS